MTDSITNEYYIVVEKRNGKYKVISFMNEYEDKGEPFTRTTPLSKRDRKLVTSCKGLAKIINRDRIEFEIKIDIPIK